MQRCTRSEASVSIRSVVCSVSPHVLGAGAFRGQSRLAGMGIQGTGRKSVGERKGGQARGGGGTKVYGCLRLKGVYSRVSLAVDRLLYSVLQARFLISEECCSPGRGNEPYHLMSSQFISSPERGQAAPVQVPSPFPSLPFHSHCCPGRVPLPSKFRSQGGIQCLARGTRETS